MDKEYRCEGCGAFLNSVDIEPYGDSFCHVMVIDNGHGHPEPHPCGPVVEYKENNDRRRSKNTAKRTNTT
jgi:hypothetical protein